MDLRVQAFFLFYHILVICPEKIRGEIAGKDMKLTNFRVSALDKAPESPYNDPYSRVKACGI